MVRFYAGKGGVGKTTCAAAEAVALARGGARTLLVSTDPAHSLGDALALKLGGAPRRVAGRLSALELDADRALSRWLSRNQRSLRVLASRGTYLDEEDIDSLFRLTLPGVDELLALVEIERLRRGFEEVVVDTAPTGHTLRLLQTPATLERIASVLDDLQGKHRALLASLRGFVRTDAQDAVIAELQGHAATLHALLRSPEVEFHWVLLAEPMALEETRDGVRALREGQMTVARLIANRLTPAPDRRCALCSARRAEQAETLLDAVELGLPLFGIEECEGEPRGVGALRKLQPRPVEQVRRGRLQPVRHERKAPASLDALAPAGRRLLLFGGKGGVGKTSAAAAASLALAGQGHSVLLLSTDPAHSLSDAFGAAIGDQEREVAPGLRARELDADRALASRRAQLRDAVEELFSALRGGAALDAPYDRAVMQDLVELTPPGVDELFGLLAVIDGLERHDLVVVDTAPTGHTLRLLQLCAHAREWVQVLLQILLKYRKVTGLGTLARDLTETARELRQFDELLHDPARTGFVAVTRAAELPLAETGRLLTALRRLRIAVPAVLVNALTPPGCSRCTRAKRREERLLRALRSRRRPWAMLGAPRAVPGPRGAGPLLDFAGTWTRMG